MKSLIPCAIALCIALPVQAQTYKWVDDKGVTNYSSSPPAGKAKAKVVEEDQISVIPQDPDLERQGEALRKREARRAAEQAKADSQRRQQQQAAAPQVVPSTAPPEPPYDDAWWYGGGYGYPWDRPVVRPPRPTHPISGNRPARPVSDMPLLDAPPATRSRR